ncbi:hypothetical protein CYMTET_26679 [Cymbomonas tetramitiformis]|uniref:Uncharacterized protein n=1 Tax=Cymbomonas tetramitiformis TaxID=36881 RepID=A0AAE0FRK5_9CHLO|nr:hypothetical protein CYMTET_26679 [Cymbomonas tetramitiformis]
MAIKTHIRDKAPSCKGHGDRTANVFATLFDELEELFLLENSAVSSLFGLTTDVAAAVRYVRFCFKR